MSKERLVYWITQKTTISVLVRAVVIVAVLWDGDIDFEHTADQITAAIYILIELYNVSNKGEK